MTKLSLLLALEDNLPVIPGRSRSAAHPDEPANARTSRLAQLIEASPAVLYAWGINSNGLTVTWVGDNVTRLLGYPRHEVLTPNWWLRNIHPEDKDQAIAAHLGMSDTRQLVCQYRFRRQDGAWLRLQDQQRLRCDAAGSFVEVVGCWSSLEEPTVREAALPANEERFLAQVRDQDKLLDLAPDAILIGNLEATVLFWNRGAEQLYGWTAAEALGQNVADLVFHDADAFETARQALLRDGEWSGQLRQVDKTGRGLVVSSRWALMRQPDGAPQSVFIINTDITESKELERRLLRAQRLESVGVLAGGIAHDLNNLLAPILLSAEIMELRVRDAEDRDLLGRIKSSAQRGADVLKQVLTFARGIDGERAQLQPRGVIQEVAKIVQETFPKTITLALDLPADLWNVMGDTTQLQQVLLNLCLNARDAMPDGGCLEVSATNATLDESAAAFSPDAKPGPYVLLQVKDTGCGMAACVVDKIFEPFFTTKPQGQGTGLGLSSALGILKSHHGFLHVYSEPGRGSVFKVGLPAKLEPLVQKMEVPPTLSPGGRGELILVVDDELGFREVTRAVLTGHGYRVLLAADGAEALEVFLRHAGKIHLVLTDLMMPRMTGAALIQALRRLDSAVKIIAASGLSSSLAANGSRTSSCPEGATALLAKPFATETLLQILDQLLHH